MNHLAIDLIPRKPAIISDVAGLAIVRAPRHRYAILLIDWVVNGKNLFSSRYFTVNFKMSSFVVFYPL